MTTSTPTDANAVGNGRRDRLRLPLMVLGPLVVVLVAIYGYLHSGRVESTDDAYVEAAQVAISADVAGQVTAVEVRNNQAVHRGQVLFRLDDATFRIAVESARAALAASRLKVLTLKADYRQRQAALAAAQDTLRFRRTEHDRARRLLASGVASADQVDQASHALDQARTQVADAQAAIEAVAASLGGDPNAPVPQHPDVQAAQARLDHALLDLSHTIVRAPQEGIATRVDELQVGNRIAADTPVFALIVTGDTWIEANFKEDQLAHMHDGQQASVEIDRYPDHRFTGRVVSMSPGTGSQFSVLPPENATGNWVKVVQRLPVRIMLDHPDPALPLETGLSASVSVDTGYQRHLFGGAEAATLPARGKPR